MERFRLRVRQEPKRGMLWELHLFPERPSHELKEADSRVLGSSSIPESIQWLRTIADTYLRRAEEPEPIAGNEFGPTSEPRWLKHQDGMRLALAFSSVRYLTKASQRRRFREGLESLPSEVLLYWFVLCFYGYRQAAGRAALRTLLTHEEPVLGEDQTIVMHTRIRRNEDEGSDLFTLAEAEETVESVREDEAPYGEQEEVPEASHAPEPPPAEEQPKEIQKKTSSRSTKKASGGVTKKSSGTASTAKRASGSSRKASNASGTIKVAQAGSAQKRVKV